MGRAGAGGWGLGMGSRGRGSERLTRSTQSTQSTQRHRGYSDKQTLDACRSRRAAAPREHLCVLRASMLIVRNFFVRVVPSVVS